MPPLAELLWIRLQNSVSPKDSDVALQFVSTITVDMPVLWASCRSACRADPYRRTPTAVGWPHPLTPLSSFPLPDFDLSCKVTEYC